MRYDKEIYFVTNGANFYDVETGNYLTGNPVKVPAYASIMDTRADTMRLVYGEIRQGSYTIQLQNHAGVFDYIEYNGKKYSVDYRRTLRHKETFVVSERQ